MALNPLEIKGYKFFDSKTGEEVVIRGIDYYPRPNHGDLNHNSLDYYTEEHRHIWERDIKYFKELGVNAIRLYAVDSEQDHDSFMCALDAAGIYVVVALAHDCATCAITSDPAPDCYPVELKAQGQAVIKSFAKYPNTLAFSAGNEVNHYAPPGFPQLNAPCQKKFLRDMREYVASCSHAMRKVPIGLVSADSDREANAKYYNCQGDPDDEFESAEWYGLNSYVSCDGKEKTFAQDKGLNLLLKSFGTFNYSIPVLMTEFGCLSDTFPTVDGYDGVRNFLEAKWIQEEPKFRNIFAGGFAFEYSIEYANAANDSPYPFKSAGKQSYGIGYFEPKECDDIETPCDYHPLPSFNFLKKAYTESTVTNLTTKDEFVVPGYRQGRSRCPISFPPLNSFRWEADQIPFSVCPSHKQAAFTCAAPLVYDIGLSFPGDAWTYSAAGVSAVLSILIIALVVTRFRNNSANSLLDEEETSSHGSNESTGLLSLNIFRASKSPYQAIESDSSSDEVIQAEIY